MNTEVYCGMSKESYRKSVGRRIRAIGMEEGMTLEEFNKILGINKIPLTGYADEKLQAEIDRRKSPHGNAD